MKAKWFSALLKILPSMASPAKPQKPANGFASVNPKDILFSLPTICDPLPATQPGSPNAAQKALSEDDWRQIEFVPAENRDHIQAKLSELAAFRQTHRRGQGFAKLFIRPEHPTTFASAGFAADQLPRLSAAALSLGGGFIVGGFALFDRGDRYIYGQRSPDGLVHHLAVSPSHGDAPSTVFRDALAELAATRLLLVDWYANIIVDTASPAALEAWARRYQ